MKTIYQAGYCYHAGDGNGAWLEVRRGASIEEAREALRKRIAHLQNEHHVDFHEYAAHTGARYEESSYQDREEGSR